MQHTERALAMAEKEMSGREVGYLPIPATSLLRERVFSALEHIPFYRNLYAPLGPAPDNDDDFLNWFATLPIVSKTQIQAAGIAGLLNPQYKRSELIPKATSGSTGIPFNLLLSNTLIDFRKWRFQRPHQRVVNEPPTKLVFIFPWDFVARTPREEITLSTASRVSPGAQPGQDRILAAPGATKPGSFVSIPKKTKKTAKEDDPESPDGHQAPVLDRPYTVNSWLPLDQLFVTLHQLQPATLIGFASSLAALARWMSDHGERIPSLKQVWTTSEVISPEGTEAIRSAMGCDPLTIYASNEFGFMAWQAEFGRPLCFDSDRLHVESIERDGPSPAGLGELSRIVVTDLLNDTMPLLRYDIADIARPCPPIHLNSNLSCASIDDLQGKEADLLRPTDGRIVTTFQVLGAIKDNLPDAQYRFIGLGLDTYVLQYCPGPGFKARNLAPTIHALRAMLGEGAEIITQQVASIRREPSGKLRPLVNLQNMSTVSRRSLGLELGVGSFLTTHDHRASATATVARALGVAQGRTPYEPVDEQHELYADLGLNSLQFLRLIAEIEREIEREIDDEDLLGIDLITVGDLVGFTQRMLAAT